MQLSVLTLLFPVFVAGFIIPDPETARQLVLESASDTSSIKECENNPLSQAFQEAYASRNKNIPPGERKNENENNDLWDLFKNEELSLWQGLQEWLGGFGGRHGHHGDDDDGHGRQHHRPHHEDNHHGSELHDILEHHGFLNQHDKHPHSQPHGDHGHDGLSGHHDYHDIPKPIHDGHYHSNSTVWDLVNSCPETSIFASLAKKDSQFLNLLKDSKQNVTIFVPSDHAFKRLFRYGILPPEKDIPSGMLANILNYHSAIGTHVSHDLIHHNTLISRLQDDKLGKGYHQRLRLGLDQVHGPSVNFFADILLTDVVSTPFYFPHPTTNPIC